MTVLIHVGCLRGDDHTLAVDLDGRPVTQLALPGRGPLSSSSQHPIAPSPIATSPRYND